MRALTTIVREYYQRIDANDVDWVLARFSPQATYDRAGVTYRGAHEIRDFFCVQRQIRGVHRIEELWTAAPHVVFVLGQFSGAGASGDARTVRFSDVWWFDPDSRISHRETFLARGHDYVRAQQHRVQT
ncbi:MAG: nuclear transport factor 2 family protein [Proteobacteria bacterium]|nr:nuclear transport factor 2 family protein [Pseudomonadota bacterium]